MLVSDDDAFTVSAARLTLRERLGGPWVGTIWICSLPGGAASWMLLDGEMDWARSNIGRAALHSSAVKTAIPAAWRVSRAKARNALYKYSVAQRLRNLKSRSEVERKTRHEREMYQAKAIRKLAGPPQPTRMQ